MKPISEFKGEYFFLSNFYSADVTYRGITYKNNEAAFQAMKCPEVASSFSSLNPSEAKRLGRRVKLRPDWEAVKEDVMRKVCFAKFFQNYDLMERLLATAPAELIEGNDWGDKEWGVCDGEGNNKLGKILMEIRDFFAQERAQKWAQAFDKSISKSEERRIRACADELFDEWLEKYLNQRCL